MELLTYKTINNLKISFYINPDITALSKIANLQPEESIVLISRASAEEDTDLVLALNALDDKRKGQVEFLVVKDSAAYNVVVDNYTKDNTDVT